MVPALGMLPAVYHLFFLNPESSLAVVSHSISANLLEEKRHLRYEDAVAEVSDALKICLL